MNTPGAKLLVRTEGDSACIRIIGRANFTSSVDFRTLVNQLCESGCKCFLLDLSECTLMDSTFLGLLASLGVKLNGGNGNGTSGGIELFNPSPRITELLETLGVLNLFNITQGSALSAAAGEAVPQAASSPSKAEVTRTCIEAHQALMALNPANEARFKDVTRFLAEDLERSESK
jgi:anti-sigma B factor antagonist